jgi:hypothetical protein
MQALIPLIQLGVMIIVGASTTRYRDRQHGNANDKARKPKAIVHVILTGAAEVSLSLLCPAMLAIGEWIVCSYLASCQTTSKSSHWQQPRRAFMSSDFA